MGFGQYTQQYHVHSAPRSRYIVMTQRVKTHILTSRRAYLCGRFGLLSPAPDPWAIAHAAGGHGARCQVALTTEKEVLDPLNAS